MQEENRNLKITLAGSQKTDVKILPFDNQTIEDITEKIPVLKDGYDITVNSKIIPKDSWSTFSLYPQDNIVCIPNFGVGAIALAIMGLAAAPAVALTMAYITYIALYAAISIGISLGVGYLIKSLTPSPKKTQETPSQAYSWEPRTTQRQGEVKPKIFGKFKSLGNIIAGHVNVLGSDNTKLVMNALVCHGTGPIKSFSDNRLNNQPFTNFPDVSYDTRRGLLEQTAISAFTPLKIQFRPNVTITNSGGALTWEVPDNDYDDIEIIMRFNIYYFHKSGGAATFNCGVKIECRELPAGGWSTIFDSSITNKGTKPFWKSFLFSDYAFTVNRGTKYEIKVTKTSSDNVNVRSKRDVALEFVTEVSTDSLQYPGLVLVGITGVLTDAFTGLQSTSTIIEGQIVYQWDDVGEDWILDWTDNPGWVAASCLSQPVISGDGSGTPYAIEKLEGLPNDRINWDDVKELVAHSDTECPDGKGGTESLITFNGTFDTAISTWDATLNVCKIARAVPIWKGNIVDFVIDKPTARSDIIAAGNILDGSFDETFLPKKDRVSAIAVAYNDINTNYERVFLHTFSGVLPESSNVLTLDFPGIVKKTEAWRLAKFHQSYNDLIMRTVKCKADVDALTYKLGDVLGVQWDATNWNKLKEIGQRGSGRIKAFTYDVDGDIITLDYDIEEAFESGSTYEILIRLRDNTQVLKTITSAVGNVVTISGHYTVEPSLDDLWIVGLQNYIVKDFRLINRNRSKSISYELTLMEYNEDVWANDLLEPPITGLYTTPAKSDGAPVIRPVSAEDLALLVPQIGLGTIPGGGVDMITTSNIKFVSLIPGDPTGPDLCVGTTNGDTLPEPWPPDDPEERQITFGSSFEIVAGVKYAIVVRAENAVDENDAALWMMKSAGGYSNGAQYYSNDAGSTWAVNAGADVWFKTLATAAEKDTFTFVSEGAGAWLYGSAFWSAQTFTATSSYTITSVILALWRRTGATPGTITVSIRAVVESGVGWEAEDGLTDMILNYLGETYIIVPGNTEKKYIYWDPDTSETILQTTDLQSVLLAGDFSVLCFGDEGIPYVY